MRFQRLIIPVLFLVLLVLAYAAAAQGANAGPEPYTAPSLVVVEQVTLPGADAALLVVDANAVCHQP